MSGAAGRAAAVSFLRAVEDACAERLVPVPGGHAVLDGRHPALWDANHLRVETEAADADALMAAAEAQLARLAFRAIHVLHDDPGAGAALEAPLRAHGYLVRHDLLMLLDAAAAPAAAETVVEVAPAEVGPTYLAAARDAGLAADVGRQLASRGALVAAAVPVRWFGVRVRGTLAARCALLGDGAVAQVENVWTAPAHRLHGHARVLVAHAAHAAREAGAEVVLLRTAAADWPQRLYRRLGFADAGPLPRYRADASQSSSPASSSAWASSS